MILSVLLPIFSLPALGWFFSKYSVRPNDWVAGVRELTTYLLIPCLLFKGAYQSGLPRDTSLNLLLAFYVPLLLHFCVTLWFWRRHPMRASLLLASHFGSSIYVGLPVVQLIVGDQGLEYLFPIVAFQALLLFTLYYLVGHTKSLSSLIGVLWQTLRNPIVSSMLLGLVLHVCGVPLPELLLECLSLISQAALPCVLLVMGASMTQFNFKGKISSLWVVLQKIVTIPVVVWSLLWLFNLPEAAQQVVLILAICPVGVSAYVLFESEDDQEAVQMGGSSILLSSLAFALILPLVVHLFQA